MKTDLADQVHDLMEYGLRPVSLTDIESRAPARVSVVRRAVLRSGLGHGRAVVVAAAVTAVACAGAVAAAQLTGGSSGPANSRLTRAQTTAYAIKRVENALAAANFVIQGRGTGTMTFPAHGRQVHNGMGLTASWSYGNRWRTEEFTPGGKPYSADGTALIGGRLTWATVTYYNHKYSLAPWSRTHLKACSTTAQLVLGGPAVTMPNWPAFIKAMLGCQAAAVTGHARIGGVETTVISGSVDVPLSKGYGRTVREKRVRVRYALDVDPATYLPVRAYGSTETYGGAAGPTVVANVTDIQWLRPTPANIAKALVTIPDGFQR
jgi:hypothetical protein